MSALTVVLPHKTVTLWRLRAFVMCFTFFFALALFLRSFWPLIFLVASTLYLFLNLWYLPRLVKSFKADKTSRGIVICYGVFKKRQKLYVVNANAPIFCVRTPLSALLGLESAYIRTAYAFILLPERERGGWCGYV